MTHICVTRPQWVNNGLGNSLLSDGAKPLPDPMLTSHQYAPLWLSISVMTYIDDEIKFEWIIFKMSPGFNELRDLSGKALKKLLMHLNRAIYVCDLTIDPCVCFFPDLVTGSGSANTETEMSSFWRNFRHWLHWKLSFWHFSVKPVMKISSKWWHFRFSESRKHSQRGPPVRDAARGLYALAPHSPHRSRNGFPGCCYYRFFFGP